MAVPAFVALPGRSKRFSCEPASSLPGLAADFLAAAGERTSRRSSQLGNKVGILTGYLLYGPTSSTASYPFRTVWRVEGRAQGTPSSTIRGGRRTSSHPAGGFGKVVLTEQRARPCQCWSSRCSTGASKALPFAPWTRSSEPDEIRHILDWCSPSFSTMVFTRWQGRLVANRSRTSEVPARAETRLPSIWSGGCGHWATPAAAGPMT